MRCHILALMFVVLLGAGQAKAQYDFYEFMNSAGNTVAQQQGFASSGLRLAQNGEANSPSHQALVPPVGDLPSLDELEMINDLTADSPYVLTPPAAGIQPPSMAGQGLLDEQSVADDVKYGPLRSDSPCAQSHQQACDLVSPRTGCGCGHQNAVGAMVMPYREPTLPAPSSLYGYFNSPPAYAHLWDTYPQEAAIRAARSHHATQPYARARCVRGELVEPCR